MFLLRLLVVGGIIGMAVCALLYFATKDRRYLNFLKMGGKFVFVIAASIMLFLVFERLAIMI
jgi:hypothetical protein